MRKSGKWLALMLATGLALTGCSGSTGEAGQTETTQETAAVADAQAEVTPVAEENIEVEAAAADETAQTETAADGSEGADGSTETAEEYAPSSPLCLLKSTQVYEDAAGSEVLAKGERDIIKLAPSKTIDFGYGADDYKALSDKIDSIMKAEGTSFDAAYEDLKVTAGEIDGSWLPAWEKSKISVPRADNYVFSMIIMGAYYAGGAHGNEGITTYCLDSETGEELSLDKIVKDTSKLPDMIMNAIDKDISVWVEKDYFETAISNNEISYVLDNVGLTFYFAPYEIASYADGIVTATIPFFNNDELFNGKYSWNTAPMSYAAHLTEGVKYADYTVSASDITPLYVYSASGNGAGPITEISVHAGSYSDTQTVDNAQFVEYTYFEYVDAGRIVFAEVTGADGTMSTYIWKIDTEGAGISLVDKIDNMCAPMYSPELDGVSYFQLLEHPEAMTIEKNGKKDTYVMGSDGIPFKP